MKNFYNCMEDITEPYKVNPKKCMKLKKSEPYDKVENLELLTVPETPLEIKTKSLHNFIASKIESTEKNIEYFKTSALPDKDEQIYLAENALNVYKRLAEIEITDELRYEFIEYVFNNGYLRTAKDIDLKSSEIRQKRQQEIYNSKEYKRFYHPFIVFILCMFLLPPFALGCWGGFPRLIEDPLKTLFESVIIYCIGPMPFIFSGLAVGITLLYCKWHSSKFGVPIEPTVSCAVAGAALAGATTCYVSAKVHDKQRDSRSKEV